MANFQDRFGQWVIDGRTVAGVETEADAIALLEAMKSPAADAFRITPVYVDQELTRRKIAAMNAMATDGSVVRNADELTARTLYLGNEFALLSRRESKGTITEDEQALLDRIDDGYAFMRVLDAAAAEIKADIASGTITTLEAIADDLRWPALPESAS